MFDEEELEVRQMFLEEAQEYVDTMDDGLMGIDPQSSSFKQQMDLVLRAAHSLKGAAGIMQYHELSETAHRLEDSLKVIKSNQPEIDITAERLILNGVGLLREIILTNRQGQEIEKAWLEHNYHQIFEPLETYLSNAESHAVEDEPEVEIDIAALMFEQEINEMLDTFKVKLEAQLDSSDLQEELQNLTSELADLGEMLELPSFVQLNKAIAAQIQSSSSDQIQELASAALMVFRRSQALVVEGNKADISSEFNFDSVTLDDAEITSLTQEQELDSLSLEEFAELDNLAIADLDFNEFTDEVSDELPKEFPSKAEEDQLDLDMALVDLNLETEEPLALDNEEDLDLDDLWQSNQVAAITEVEEEVNLSNSLSLDDFEETNYEELKEPIVSTIEEETVDELMLDSDANLDMDFELEPDLQYEDQAIARSTSEQSYSIENLSDHLSIDDFFDSESTNNPFIEINLEEEEIDNLDLILNPFGDFGDHDYEQTEITQDIFSADPDGEPLIEISLVDQNIQSTIQIDNPIDRFTEPVSNQEEVINLDLQKLEDKDTSSLTLDNIFNDLEPKPKGQEFKENPNDLFNGFFPNSTSNAVPEVIEASNRIQVDHEQAFPQLKLENNQDLDDLFSDFFDSPPSKLVSDKPVLEIELVKEEVLPASDRKSNADRAQAKSNQDTISDLFNDFFNSSAFNQPVQSPDHNSATKTLGTDTVNDLFDSFLESSDFSGELSQGLFPDSSQPQGIDSFDDFEISIEKEKIDVFSDFSNSNLDRNLSRYIKEESGESGNPEMELFLPDTLEDLQEDLEFSGDVPESIPTKVSDLVTTYVKDTSIRLPISRLDQLHDLSGEMIVGHNSLDGQLKQLRQLLKSLHGRIRTLEDANYQLAVIYDRMNTETATKTESVNLADNLAEMGEFDILEFDSYSELHSLSQSVSEAIVQLQELVEDVDLSLNETEQNANGLTSNFRQLQTAIKETKMRPLKDIVGRFPRAIRSMNLQHNKAVDLILNGTDLLIEQTILDVINDPLNHLLRNAFDHGIEDRNIRIKNGKTPKGKIEISAVQADQKVLITVADDGGGINPDTIKAKVERSPLAFGLTANQVSAMTNDQLIQLIFEPGFTTTDKVTSLSGRGVGMDVVKTNLQQINAEIHTQTQLGVGTTFTIAIPFTLSALRITLIEVNQMILGIPTDFIQAVIPNFSDSQDQFYQWQDSSIPIFPLSNHLQLNSARSDRHLEDKPVTATKSILIINQERQTWGIYVNGCWGEQEVTLRQPLGDISLPKIFMGCAITANGQTVPIIDMQIFGQTSIKVTSNNSLNSKSIISEPAIAKTLENSILVVDDSINVRRYLALFLKKAGFKVEQAKDGEEAIAKLREGLTVNVVLSDVEMPRLDGYGLLSQIKSTPNLQYLPVVMLTSRSGDKHRDVAINLGAAAYFTKPFVEDELIQRLRELALTVIPQEI